MMMSELERLVETITREKNIPRDVVVEILESAVEAAARKKYGQELDIMAQYNDELGEVELFKFVRVVEEVEDDEVEIDLATHTIRSGETEWTFPAMSESVVDILRSGGLIPFVLERFRTAPEAGNPEAAS